jgi:hypothetical protein
MAFMALARTRWFELACDCDSDNDGDVDGDGDDDDNDGDDNDGGVGGDNNNSCHGEQNAFIGTEAKLADVPNLSGTC